ncbi:MAG: CBS domain-containing protein, partial [Candidatus Altiarchaeales archaeon]|nr:CBS domain-containing protein [Candidatus Altiarchaeales archaeon]
RLDCPVKKAVKVLGCQQIGSLVVTDEYGGYVGLLTDKVLFDGISSGFDFEGKRLSDLDLEPLVTVSMHAGINDILPKFEETKSDRLGMVDEKGALVGILKKKNLDRFSTYEVARKLLKK